ncbi:MAG: hypothetical protein AB1Z98_14650 [Nannocystaceae bacterium]
MRSSPERSAGAAISVGGSRTRAAWRDVAVAYLLSLLLSLPVAAARRASRADSLHHREAAERLLQGWDGLWHWSFSARARGLESTFDAGIVGIGAVLRSLDHLLRGAVLDLPAPLVVAGLSYLVGWVFLSGALLARFGGDDGGLLRLGARYFGRMLSLAAVAWLAWALLFGLLLPSLGHFVDERCREVIDQRVVAAWTLGKYAVVWSLVLAVRVIVDLAKVRAVQEPSVTVLAALREALAIVRRRGAAVLALVLALGGLSLGLLLAYWLVAPGAGQDNVLKIGLAFGLSQTSVIARVVMRAWSLASLQALVGGSGRSRAQPRPEVVEQAD